MKATCLRGAILLLFAFSAAALGQEAQPSAETKSGTPAAGTSLKIGFVNLEEVMRGYYKAEKTLARLDIDLKEKEAAVEKMADEIKKLRAEKELLSESARLKKEEEIMEKTMALRKFRQEVEQDLEFKIHAERKKLEKENRDKIEEKAKAMGYALVFVGELILYKDPSLNITAEIVKELNRDKPQ